MRIKTIFSIIIVMTLMISACSNVESQGFGKAPNFTLSKSGGGEITLSEELKGRQAVLVFFATWCPSCVTKVPAINEFYERYRDKVSVMGVNIQESDSRIQSFINKKGVKYPIFLDSEGKVAGLYGIRGIPAVFVVNSGGEIVYQGHSIEEAGNKLSL
ncbi:MAG: TlpA family protein disulfide reductase [Candidatus Omnitrophica bacterium]|nr:TlpA family protein disulfide reductase [Candidatus Omnitrophota bacterium]